jgi:hypothetical protein
MQVAGTGSEGFSINSVESSGSATAVTSGADAVELLGFIII